MAPPMGRYLFAILATGLLFPSLLRAERKWVELPAGVPIPLETLKEIDTRTTNRFERLPFKTLRDIKMGESLVIKEGARGWALISAVDRPGYFGHPARFTIEMRSLTAVDGQKIFLGHPPPQHLRQQDRNHSATLGGTLYYHYGTPFLLGGAGVLGFEKKLPKGYRFYGSTTRPIKIWGINPFPLIPGAKGPAFQVELRAFDPQSGLMWRERLESLHRTLTSLRNGSVGTEITITPKILSPDHAELGRRCARRLAELLKTMWGVGGTKMLLMAPEVETPKGSSRNYLAVEFGGI